jgi:hypothetical protein
LRYWSNEAQAGDSSTTGSFSPTLRRRGPSRDRAVERAAIS